MAGTPEIQIHTLSEMVSGVSEKYPALADRCNHDNIMKRFNDYGILDREMLGAVICTGAAPQSSSLAASRVPRRI